MSSPKRTSSSGSGAAASSGSNKKKGAAVDERKKFSYPKNAVAPAVQPLDVLFNSQDVIRALALPPNVAVKIAESAGTLYAASQPKGGGGGGSKPGTASTSSRPGTSGGGGGGAPSSGSSRAGQNQALKARSTLQEMLESLDGDAVGRMHHANLVVSTFANAALVNSRQTQRQYESLFQGAQEEAVKLQGEMEERDRDAVRVVDFLRSELEQKHILHQRLMQEHKVQMSMAKEKADKEIEAVRLQLREKETINETLQREISRLQGEMEKDAEFRRERILVAHEHKRHAEAEEELTQKFEREITQLKFQNLEDRLRLRAVENQMCEKFQDEVHAQASKLVDAKGRAIRIENAELREHTMRLHDEVENLTSAVEEKGEQLHHTQREVELSLQTQGEYARRGLIQSRVSKDAIEKVKLLQSELSAQSREAKAMRNEDKMAHERKVTELEAKLDAAHASLLSHRRDLVKTRQLAQRIVAQRSELEQFFYDALEYVAAQRAADEQQQPQHEGADDGTVASATKSSAAPAAQLGTFLQQRDAAASANKSINRKTITTELRVLPNQIRAVVSARRDIGYRGDLDAAVVPGSDAGPAGAHRGLQAHSARRPPQGCFSAQPDFAVSRTSQTFMTQPAGMKSEFAPLPSHQQPPPVVPATARRPQPTGFLMQERRKAEEEQLRQINSNIAGRQASSARDDEHGKGLDVEHQEQHSAPSVSRALTASSVAASNNGGGGGGGDSAICAKSQSPRSKRQKQQQQQLVAAAFPEMHNVMQDAENVSSDFKGMAWYDKEKIICAMLYHLNRASMRQQQQQHSEGGDGARRRDSRRNSNRTGGSNNPRQEDGRGEHDVDDNTAHHQQQQQLQNADWASGDMQPVEFDDGDVIDGLGDDPHGVMLHHQRRDQQQQQQQDSSSESTSRVGTADTSNSGRGGFRVAGAGARVGSSSSKQRPPLGAGQQQQQQQQMKRTPQQPAEPISWEQQQQQQQQTSSSDAMMRASALGRAKIPKPPSSSAVAAIASSSSSSSNNNQTGNATATAATPRPATQGSVLPEPSTASSPFGQRK